ncbi:baseplate J/gp47 family protein [Nostocaceae cyanobacterium CENA369]|uniref:Baseplate J/gp47 family protein n=1 Tax=Dendronalium phyllosphericum CENA369 TaxID=1725256 RepID=A0A8J7ICL4_9NOST|nr:baseplate J/gp47 family protein [Dendronalium phyllosphericum]MBH8577223.1 baseplate J/gp47 family protein [Dendronalium phyllosphericum CENA369]
MANTEIPKLVLDPQNDDQLVQLAFDRIREASGGQLNDFRPGSPLAASVEGQVFALAELLFYLNMLPEALALEVFRLSGVTRNAGTKATGYLRFLLQTPLGSDFIINAGYSVPFKDSFFVLQEQLYIPAGATEADVLVQVYYEGSDLNCPAFGILISSTGVNCLQTIYNAEAITGGSDLETLKSTITRAQTTNTWKSDIVPYPYAQ